MLRCSCFRSFIKSGNVSRTGNFIKKCNFVSMPWKIIIPLANSVGDPMWVIQMHLMGNDIFTPKCHFLTILCKTLTVAGVLRRNIQFFLSISKIKLDPT